MNNVVFPVFNGKREISIPANVLEKYQYMVGRFAPHTAEYFMVVLELTEDMDNEELSSKVVEAMLEDCTASEKVKEILSSPEKRKELFHA